MKYDDDVIEGSYRVHAESEGQEPFRWSREVNSTRRAPVVIELHFPQSFTMLAGGMFAFNILFLLLAVKWLF